jgi:hypothetical protein
MLGKAILTGMRLRQLSSFDLLKWIAVFLFAFTGHQGLAQEKARLSPQRIEALKEYDMFRDLKSVTNLPPAVFKLAADENGLFADPGERWNASDVLIAKIPRRRLVWAVRDGPCYVVHYEEGGYAGRMLHVLVVELKDGAAKPTFIWRGRVPQGGCKDFWGFVQEASSLEGQVEK